MFHKFCASARSSSSRSTISIAPLWGLEPDKNNWDSRTLSPEFGLEPWTAAKLSESAFASFADKGSTVSPATTWPLLWNSYTSSLQTNSIRLSNSTLAEIGWPSSWEPKELRRSRLGPWGRLTSFTLSFVGPTSGKIWLIGHELSNSPMGSKDASHLLFIIEVSNSSSWNNLLCPASPSFYSIDLSLLHPRFSASTDCSIRCNRAVRLLLISTTLIELVVSAFYPVLLSLLLIWTGLLHSS